MESIIGVNAIRVGRLRSNGTPDYFNMTGGFAICGGVSTFKFDFEVEAGSTIFKRDAAGRPCVNRKRPDDVKWATFELELCRDDVRFTELVLGGQVDLLTDTGGNQTGRGFKPAAGCGSTASSRAAVCLELWTELQDCDQFATPYRYRRIVLPQSFLTPAGYTLQDDVSLPIYKGYSQSNANIGNGPFNDFFLSSSVGGYCMFDFGDDALPICPSPVGYVPLPHS